MTGCKSELAELLGDAFDPASKESILAKVEAVVRGVADQQLQLIRRTVDSDHEDSPLGRFRREIQGTIKEQAGQVLTAVNQLTERIAVREAEVKLLDKTTGKGFTFEDRLHATVTRLVAPHGDLAEKTGRTTGATGSQVGDEVVTVNPEDVRGQTARYVLEAKDRKLGLKAILDELDEAAENREALAAVAVFSRADHAPTPVPFQYFGNRAIVVLDKDEPDEGPLRLACMWARWVVRRQLAERCETIDVDRIASLIDDAARALARATKIKAAHSAARNKIDEAAGFLVDLLDEVEEALEALRTEVAK